MKRIIGILVLSVVLAGSLSATLATNVTWQVDNASASDSNGGGFVPGASGTDYSISSTSAHCTSSDFTLVSGTTLATSVSCPFGSDSVGNVIHVTTTGTGGFCTVGYYQVVSVSAVTATLDRAAGTTSCASGTFFIGGPIKTLGQLNTAMNTSNVEQHAYVKSATYSISSGVNFNFNLTSTVGADITGYTTTRPTLTTPGDGGRPTIQTSAGSITMMTLSNNNAQFNLTFQNFILDANGQAAITCFSMNNNTDVVRNVKATGCQIGFTDAGFAFNGERLTATAMGTTNGLGIRFSNGGHCIDCYVGDSSASGITGFAFPNGDCIRCIAANLTGSTNSDGFSIGNLGIPGVIIDSAVCYNVSRTCFSLINALSSNFNPLTIKNSIAASVGAFCFDASNASPPTVFYGGLYEDYNACWQNSGTGTYHNFTAGVHDVLLSANPFTNGSSQDFSLNSTVGGGAALKGVGFPGTLLVGGTGFQSIGTLQPQGSSGSQIVNGYAQ